MGRPFTDYTGKQINDLYVLERVGSEERRGKVQPIWKCICSCGALRILSSGELRQGRLNCCDFSRHRDKASLLGERFGSLLVVKYSHYDNNNFWECLCDCGNTVVECKPNLLNGKRTSCGCGLTRNKRRGITQTVDELGNIYGELTVIEELDVRDKNKYWLCECSCGNIVEVRGVHLRNGSVRSCGCKSIELANQKRITHGMSGTSEYALYQRRKRNKLEQLSGEWDYEMEQFLRELFPYCVVCGMTEEEHLEQYGQRLHVDHIRPLSEGNGLDISNATILCHSCNSFKHNKQLDNLPQDMRDAIVQSSELFQSFWSNAPY